MAQGDTEHNATWSPGIDASRRVLRGIPARAYYSLIEWGAWAGGALLGSFLVGMVVSGTGWAGNAFLTVLVVLLGLDAIVYVPSVITGLMVRRRRELRAGYTTVIGEFSEVDQIDHATGQIVRLAGEELLTYEQYQERIKLIRSDLHG